ncbi:MAG: hypothetical protein ACR2N7_01765 [Acidimicrobiia bacterium]
MSKEDPKPGRWILPIVIVTLIGFTWVFVTSLPAADVAASTSTTVSTTTTTNPPATTTTTLPADVLAFLQEVDRFEAEAVALQVALNEVNDLWEAGEIDFDQAETGFTDVRDGAQVLANQVAATAVPDLYQPAWPDTITASQAIVAAADAVLVGLAAPDDGTARREAVVLYNDNTAAFLAQLDVVRALTP